MILREKNFLKNIKEKFQSHLKDACLKTWIYCYLYLGKASLEKTIHQKDQK